MSIVDLLLEMGALANTIDIHGRNALFYAIQYDQADCVKRLLLWGAAPKIEDIKASKCSQHIRKLIELS